MHALEWMESLFSDTSHIECCNWRGGVDRKFDAATFQLVVGGFVDAFRDGRLSNIKKLHLLSDVRPDLCGGSHRKGCKTCQDVLTYFPLSSSLLDMPCCYSLRKKVPIMLSRPGRRDMLNSKEFAIRVSSNGVASVMSAMMMDMRSMIRKGTH